MKFLVLMICVLAQAIAYSPPRLTDGKPDLNGIWEARAKIDRDLESAGVIVDPRNGKIPYTTEALRKKTDNNRDRVALDPLNKCRMPGVPRLMYISYPFQIVQSANQPVIAILSQYVHIVRNINVRGDHLDGLDLWLGDSRGRWEGDTLVVDVTNFNDQTWLDAAGDYHSDALHVVERYTRTGPDVIAYEATVTDPKVLSRPFRINMALMRHKEKNFQLLENECYAVKEGPTVTVGDKPDAAHGK
jgi:hypothetical protein